MPNGPNGGDPAHGWRRLVVEPPRPELIRDRPNAYRYAVASVCIGAFMGQLDASIVTLAFPTLQRQFHATVGDVQWVGLVYLLVLVSLVTAVGRMADMVGRKLLYIYGFVVFIAGSALCGLAPSLLALDGFRVLQAFGAAMMQANSVAIIASSVPPDRLGRSLGVQGAAQALGLALGPAVGGALIALSGWRLIFFVNVPVGLVGIGLAWFLIPRSRHLATRARFDWLGLVLFVLPVSALLLAMSHGDQLGWSSPTVVALLAIAVVGTTGFVLWQRRTPSPMLSLDLFARPQFSAGIASGLLSYMVLFGFLFVTPFYLQTARGLSPADVGLILTVLPFALGVVAPIAGRAADRVGARPLTVGGMLVAGAALLTAAFAHTSMIALVLEMALLGAGLGAFTPPNNTAIMSSAPRTHSGMASGVLNMTRGMGTAMGLAATGLVFEVMAGQRAVGAGPVGRGFTAASIMLACLAVCAAALAALRGDADLAAAPPFVAE